MATLPPSLRQQAHFRPHLLVLGLVLLGCGCAAIGSGLELVVTDPLVVPAQARWDAPFAPRVRTGDVSLLVSAAGSGDRLPWDVDQQERDGRRGWGDVRTDRLEVSPEGQPSSSTGLWRGETRTDLWINASGSMWINARGFTGSTSPPDPASPSSGPWASPLYPRNGVTLWDRIRVSSQHDRRAYLLGTAIQIYDPDSATPGPWRGKGRHPIDVEPISAVQETPVPS